MLPNFLVIGAMTSGTTSLHRYLRSHPQVFTTKQKEPEFFPRANMGNRERGLQYEELFAEAGDARAVGEASISYTQHPRVEGVPARIRDVLPDVRLMYLGFGAWSVDSGRTALARVHEEVM